MLKDGVYFTWFDECDLCKVNAPRRAAKWLSLALK